MSEEKEKKKNPFRTFVIAVAVATVAIILFFPGGNAIQGIKAAIDSHSEKVQIRKYHEEIDRMQKEIDQLKSDPDSLEKFAREQFQFAAPGDDVYIIEK